MAPEARTSRSHDASAFCKRSRDACTRAAHLHLFRDGLLLMLLLLGLLAQSRTCELHRLPPPTSRCCSMLRALALRNSCLL